jgi:hypothetical protein
VYGVHHEMDGGVQGLLRPRYTASGRKKKAPCLPAVPSLNQTS